MTKSWLKSLKFCHSEKIAALWSSLFGVFLLKSEELVAGWQNTPASHVSIKLKKLEKINKKL